MSNHHHQVSCPVTEIDLAFWKQPEGVSVPDDELSFLLVPMSMTFGRTVSRLEGGTLLIMYLGYMGWTVYDALNTSGA